MTVFLFSPVNSTVLEHRNVRLDRPSFLAILQSLSSYEPVDLFAENKTCAPLTKPPVINTAQLVVLPAFDIPYYFHILQRPI